MMKFIKPLFIIVSVIIILFLLIYFYKKHNMAHEFTNKSSSENVISNYYEENNEPFNNEFSKIQRFPEKVTMTIKDNTLTKTGATIIIKDNNEYPYTYDDWFRIDKQYNDNWKELKSINNNYIFNDIALNLKKDSILETKIDWKKLYGNLQNGKYRLVKRIYDNEYKYIFTEFIIK